MVNQPAVRRRRGVEAPVCLPQPGEGAGLTRRGRSRVGRPLVESDAGTFWEAEPEHQNCLQRHADAHMSQYVRKDWKLHRPPA